VIFNSIEVLVVKKTIEESRLREAYPYYSRLVLVVRAFSAQI